MNFNQWFISADPVQIFGPGNVLFLISGFDHKRARQEADPNNPDQFYVTSYSDMKGNLLSILCNDIGTGYYFLSTGYCRWPLDRKAVDILSQFLLGSLIPPLNIQVPTKSASQSLEWHFQRHTSESGLDYITGTGPGEVELRLFKFDPSKLQKINDNTGQTGYCYVGEFGESITFTANADNFSIISGFARWGITKAEFNAISSCFS